MDRVELVPVWSWPSRQQWCVATRAKLGANVSEIVVTKHFDKAPRTSTRTR